MPASSDLLSPPRTADRGRGPGRLATAALVLAAGVAAAATTATGQQPVHPPGVDADIETAIQRGLAYLVRTQNRDGSWRENGGYGAYPCSMTALAGMALLGSGSTPTRGPHWRPLRRATRYLLESVQGEDGLITDPATEGRSMYGHGFGTMFLAEVYGMEEDLKRQEHLQQVLRGAVGLIARSQSRLGGWYYTPESNSDEGSVTVTQIQALRACRNAGIAVPVETIDRAVGYIANSANPDGGIRYSARGGGASRPAISAAAVAVLYNAGRYDDPMAERALEYAKRHLPVSRSGGHHFYAHLYLAQALYQRGGDDWLDYYGRMSRWLLRQQDRDGSWQGDGVGSVYGTAIALTVLQLPYANIPLYAR